MLTQTIFFLALAVFIYLLARRYSFNNMFLNKIIRTLSKWGTSTIKWFLIPLLKVQIPKFKTRSIEANQKMQNTVDNDDADNNFWSEEAIADKPELSSHFEEGEQLFKKGRHKDAEQFFLKAATNKPRDPKIYARLGLLYLEQKNFSDAIEALKMATKLEKYNPSRHYNLSLAYWGNKNTRQAISSVREAISLDPITKKYRQLLEELLNG